MTPGYNWIWAIFISIIVYAGSGQFLLVSLISSAASLPTVAMMTLFINSRHMFYGLSLIDKFKAARLEISVYDILADGRNIFSKCFP